MQYQSAGFHKFIQLIYCHTKLLFLTWSVLNNKFWAKFFQNNLFKVDSIVGLRKLIMNAVYQSVGFHKFT